VKLLAAAAIVLGACSGPTGHWEPGPAPGSSSDPAPSQNDPTVQLQIMPGKTHSGVDGTHEFRVPVAVYGAKNPTLTASDSSMVAIAPATLVDTSQDNGAYFFVTATKAGTVTLTASVKGGSVTATLDIAAYTADEYSTGEQRYMNAASSGPACVQCHGGATGIDHSPSTMASASDSDVISVITTGVLVEGNPITQVRHKWAVTDAEAKGLVAYLRALAPRGFVGTN
jgi:hypothetical protein